MSRAHIAIAAAAAFAIMVGMMVSGLLQSGADALPAWLQAMGGLMAVVVSLYLALHERRQAQVAKDRYEADKADRAAEAASVQRKQFVAAFAITSSILLMLRNVKKEIPNIKTRRDAGRSYDVMQQILSSAADGIRSLASRTTDPDYLVAMIQASHFLTLKPGPENNEDAGDPADFAALVDTLETQLTTNLREMAKSASLTEADGWPMSAKASGQ